MKWAILPTNKKGSAIVTLCGGLLGPCRSKTRSARETEPPLGIPASEIEKAVIDRLTSSSLTINGF